MYGGGPNPIDVHIRVGVRFTSVHQDGGMQVVVYIFRLILIKNVLRKLLLIYCS